MQRRPARREVAQRHGQRAGLHDDGGQCGAAHAQRGQRAGTEDQQWIEQGVEGDGAHLHQHGEAHLSNRLQHGLRGHEAEHRHHSHIADVQVVRGQVVDGRLHAYQPEQWRGEPLARNGEHRGHERDHQQRLRSHMIQHMVPARAGILRDQHRAGRRQAAAQRNEHGEQRAAGRDGGDRTLAEPAHPEGIDQFEGGLRKVRQRDGQRNAQQDAEQRPFGHVHPAATGQLPLRAARAAPRQPAGILRSRQR
ncbi:MAG TPA: hypothetical protein VKO83_09010 [Steroidobacteraceae bacterium]|nr:hypothetical protein [Steroidobacteraceae bacterium]